MFWTQWGYNLRVSWSSVIEKKRSRFSFFLKSENDSVWMLKGGHWTNFDWDGWNPDVFPSLLSHLRCVLLLNELHHRLVFHVKNKIARLGLFVGFVIFSSLLWPVKRLPKESLLFLFFKALNVEFRSLFLLFIFLKKVFFLTKIISYNSVAGRKIYY